MIALIIIWSAFIAFEVWWNYRLIEVKGEGINYTYARLRRGGAALALMLLIIGLKGFYYEYLAVGFFQLSSYWATFDYALNIARGKPWYYVSQTSPGDWFLRFTTLNDKPVALAFVRFWLIAYSLIIIL